MSQKISEAIRRQNSDMSLTSIVLNLAEDTNILEDEIPTYPTYQFISDVGGLAGLVLGISMLSILTCIQKLIEYFLDGRMRKKGSLIFNKNKKEDSWIRRVRASYKKNFHKRTASDHWCRTMST